MTRDADAARTLELDAWLERADVRITRALKGVGEVTVADLFQTLELARADFGEYEIALAQLVKTGHVRCRKVDGRALYEFLFEIPVPKPRESVRPYKPGAEGEQRGAWFWWRGSWRPM